MKILYLACDLFRLLTKNQRKELVLLQILIFLVGVLELLGIAAIGVLIAMVSRIEYIHENQILEKLYRQYSFSTENDFLFIIATSVLILLIFTNLLSIFTTWRLALFSSRLGTQISDELFRFYLTRPWQYHQENNTSNYVKNISAEAGRVMDGVIQPIMLANSRLVLAILIAIPLLVYNPAVALSGLLLFVSMYCFLYYLVKNKIEENGRVVTESMGHRFLVLGESFSSLKQLILSGKQNYFFSKFESIGKKFSYAKGTNLALALTPRYVAELVAFGSMVCLVMLLLYQFQDNVHMIFPSLAVYGVASLKLLPALQLVYSCITQIQGNISGFELIKNDLMEIKNIKNFNFDKEVRKNFNFESLELESVSFKYPSQEKNTLNSINFKLNTNKVIGIVGFSGAGKSTLIDIVIGLTQPTSGRVLINNLDINTNRDVLVNWQRQIGYVPQSVVLSEGSIVENVAYGIDSADIDIEKVWQCLKYANLDGWVKTLPRGIESEVGEKGGQVSGGERQRIAIARALYADPKVLIFDEGTSALDNKTEAQIMDSIKDLGESRVIFLIAHRLNTVVECDEIIVMEGGRIVGLGDYEYLSQYSDSFRRLISAKEN